MEPLGTPLPDKVHLSWLDTLTISAVALPQRRVMMICLVLKCGIVDHNGLLWKIWFIRLNCFIKGGAVELVKVSGNTIDDLYELAIGLSESEGQRELFSATRQEYVSAFLIEPPSCFGVVAYQEGRPIGFYTYYYKFASYLGARVLYVEDLHLVEGAGTEKNKHTLLEHAVMKSRNEGCCRIEMRVLKNFNLGYDVIEMSGFEEVEKWDVYRLSL